VGEVQTLWLAVWFGGVLACLLKMLSPHGKASAWLLAALVGGFGGLVGLFVARTLGIPRTDQVGTHGIALVVSTVTVLLYAIGTRVFYASEKKHGRMSRPSFML